MKHAITFIVAMSIGVYVGSKFGDKIPFIGAGA